MFGVSNIVLVTNLCNRFGVDTSELRNCKKGKNSEILELVF
jgi:hypothetical protein